MIIKGKAQWAKIFKPVPAYGGATNEYTMDLMVDDDAKEQLREADLGHKIKSGKYEMDYIRFKIPEFTSKGDALSPPTVKDRYGRAWDEDIMIGNGSEVHVRFDIRSGTMGGKAFTKPDLREVMVWDLVEVASRETFEYDTSSPLAEPSKEVWNEDDE